jgi:hypothetical protein
LRLRGVDGRPTPVVVQNIKDNIVEKMEQGIARYYHVELINDRPLVPATNPNVYIVSIARPDAAGAFREVWSGAVPSVATYYGVHPNRILGSDPQLYDLCSVVRGYWVQLFPQIPTMDFPQFLRQEGGQPVRVRVTLQARSLEAVSDRVSFDIAWDGQWADGAEEMRHHMVVSPV